MNDRPTNLSNIFIRHNVITSSMTNATKRQSGLQKLDYNVFKNATILLMALIIPFNAIHEVGHLIPCWLSGFEGNMSVGLMGSYASCTGLHGDSLYFFSGGLLALLVAFIPLLVTRVRKNPTLAIVLSSFGLGHFMAGILELFARDFYFSDQATIIVSMISFMIFAVMLGFLGKTDIPERQIGNRKGLLVK
jgi:hypothetical protein